MKNVGFYGMELKDRKSLPIADDRISTLGRLHEALLHAWSRETAFPAFRDKWSSSNPAAGQCNITAMIVHDLFGGTIHRVRLEGGMTHYFNKIDGIYVDLTSSQFLDYAGECPLEPNTERGREKCGSSPDTWNRYRLLIDNINAWLLSESNDGRIIPLMPSGTAPAETLKGGKAREEAAGGYGMAAEKGHYTSKKDRKPSKIRQALGVCPECGGALVKRSGKYGDFLGCAHYPECRFTLPLEKAEFIEPGKGSGSKNAGPSDKENTLFGKNAAEYSAVNEQSTVARENTVQGRKPKKAVAGKNTGR